MKRVTLALVALTIAAGATLLLAQANPRGEASCSSGKISIDYGRPSAKGRDVMGMIKPGSHWRMGADGATTLKTDVDLKFGDKAVPKGSYTLVAHFVEAEKWNLVVVKSGGRASNAADVVAEVPGKLETGQDHVEQMTIELKDQGSDGELVLTWTTYRMSVGFKIG
jgi:hypothetical protein